MKIEVRIASIIVVFMSVFISCKDDKKPVRNLESNITAIDSISFELSNVINNSVIPGCAVSIIQNEKVLLNEGYGYSDIDNEIPFTNNTAHTIASISKTFIALATMQLVENGKLSLDQKVNDILPFKIRNPHFPNTPITVMHLVTHSSSINDDFDDGDKRASWFVDNLPADYDDLHTDIKEDIFYYDGTETTLPDYIISFCSPEGEFYSEENFSQFRPGTKYEYSNAGAAVAALIVEMVSGMSFSEYTRKNIFEPLDMSNTSWYYNRIDIPYSKLYVEKDGNISEFPRYHEASYPDGQLKTTSTDLTKYHIEMVKGFNGYGTLLKPKSYSYMFSHQLDRSAFDAPDKNRLNDEYGVGVFWGISEAGYILHKGGMIGVYSIIYYNPKSGIGITAFCNIAHPDFGKILNILDTYETAITNSDTSS
jgi:CubicO group peptidase (beta-lactamase class C family)